MESDDDSELFAAAVSSSPSPIGGRRLKRLKKAADVAVKFPPDPSDDGNDSFGESEGRVLDCQSVPEPDGDDEDSGVRKASVAVEGEGLGFEGGEEGSEVSRVGVKRTLGFDCSDEEESEGGRDCQGGEEGNEGAVGIGDDGGRVDVGDVGGDGDEAEKKKKKKKERKKSRVEWSGEFGVGSKDGDSAEEDAYAVAKRVSEKVRRNQLTQLRADSQRLLRESRDTVFKPAPLVHKPISSILEKIKQRKLELARKTVPFKKSSFTFPFPDLLRDDAELIVDSKEIGTKAEGGATKVVNGNSDASPLDAETDVTTLHLHDDGSNDVSSKPDHVDVPPRVEGIKQSSRSPVDDTQDLFSDSESDHAKDDLAENPRRLTEEVFAPSLLAMNLKLDSAPQDESSDEDDYDKENIDPRQSDDFSIASLGDPVKNLIDVEAEEEDDSDNDMIRFQENEEDDIDDSEELNDMIAPAYKEGDVDRERRNELHHKWLEQQDAAGTENLLQRLNCGPKKATAGLVDMMDDEEDEAQNEDEIEELSEDDEDDLAPGDAARINFRKVQQMIPQMFTDNEDAYVSSEDEEFEKRLAKQNLLLKNEFQATLVSPAEDENSREVFRLIKKLNIVPHNKKRAKSSVLNDNTFLGGRPNDLLKPSFLGRGSKSLSKNQKTNAFKAFIFGRDDSNSKSAISTCEDSLDMIETEAKPARTSSSAKLRSSQSSGSRHGSQATTTNAEAVSASSTTSLYDILRRSSVQCARSAAPVDQSKSLFSAFQVESKAKEGRVRM